MKTCSKCKEEKTLDAFGWRKDRSTYTSQCKACRYASTSEWRKATPDYSSRYKEKVKEWTIQKKYGLTPDEHKLLIELDPVCAICGSSDRLAVDHCHDTGRVRGRLCMSCNTGLGFFRDKTDLLRSAIEYLETR